MAKEDSCLLDLAKGHAGTSLLKKVVSDALCKGTVVAAWMELLREPPVG